MLVLKYKVDIRPAVLLVAMVVFISPLYAAGRQRQATGRSAGPKTQTVSTARSAPSRPAAARSAPSRPAVAKQSSPRTTVRRSAPSRPAATARPVRPTISAAPKTRITRRSTARTTAPSTTVARSAPSRPVATARAARPTISAAPKTHITRRSTARPAAPRTTVARSAPSRPAVAARPTRPTISTAPKTRITRRSVPRTTVPTVTVAKPTASSRAGKASRLVSRNRTSNVATKIAAPTSRTLVKRSQPSSKAARGKVSRASNLTTRVGAKQASSTRIGSNRTSTRLSDTGRKSKLRQDRISERTSVGSRSLQTRIGGQRTTAARSRTDRVSGGAAHRTRLDRRSVSGIRSPRIRSGAKRHSRINNYSTVVYEDHHYAAGHHRRNSHVYRDIHDRIQYRIIWPRYYYPVYYSWGARSTFSYVYPYYHRKYIFVSLGGYWPSYRYARYYWYGYHPYEWYGYYPIAREVTGDTHNYYTYNYYSTEYPQASLANNEIRPVDENTFADVRERLASEATQEPAPETPADSLFDEAVTAFEEANYDQAADKLRGAMEYAPDDMILPFAYAQALFAGERYTDAAQALRNAMENTTSEKEGVFYPRGLYSEDEVLFGQIDQLAERARVFSFDTNYQLVLGYQLLGIGKIDEAEAPLRQALTADENISAAAKLLNLLERIKAEAAEKATK
jgi:hypothetical protein